MPGKAVEKQLLGLTLACSEGVLLQKAAAGWGLLMAPYESVLQMTVEEQVG